MDLAMTPYDDLANSKYMGVAMALKFAVGAVKSGCNLLEGGVRTIVTAMCTGGRVSLMGADICAHMSKVPYFNDQVGSPNVSIYAMLVVDIEHDEVKGRWNIVDEVPGKKFGTFATTISLSTATAKIPTVPRQKWPIGLPKPADTRTRGATSPAFFRMYPRPSGNKSLCLAVSTASPRTSWFTFAACSWQPAQSLTYTRRAQGRLSRPPALFYRARASLLEGVSGLRPPKEITPRESGISEHFTPAAVPWQLATP